MKDKEFYLNADGIRCYEFKSAREVSQFLSESRLEEGHTYGDAALDPTVDYHVSIRILFLSGVVEYGVYKKHIDVSGKTSTIVYYMYHPYIEKEDMISRKVFNQTISSIYNQLNLIKNIYEIET
jgi:hypothetical protein